VKPEKNAILAYNHSRICISLRQFDRTKFEVLIALLDFDHIMKKYIWGRDIYFCVNNNNL
jgi:hypothetical protein